MLIDALKKDGVDRCALNDALNEDKGVVSVARQRRRRGGDETEC